MHVYAYNSFGYDGGLVRVEVDVRPGLPVIDVVGLAGAAVREAKERIRVALRHSGFDFPHGHILVNLAPAGMPKSGASYDLPIAYAILIKAGLIPEPESAVLVMGELTLEGEVAKVDAVLSALIEARSQGVTRALLPSANTAEAGLLGLEHMRFVSHLREALVSDPPPSVNQSPGSIPGLGSSGDGETASGFGVDGAGFDTGVCVEDPLLGLALLCSAAGAHHVLLYGPPGVGKTMALRFLGELLPALSDTELLEVNRLYSSAGLLGPETGIVNRPPVRMPHHSASAEAIVGGGRFCRPGEISLAHRGILILDEAPEFKPGNLQALREPLEDARVRISRAEYQVWFPADFTLAMALNSCPCGRLGSGSGICVCTPQDVRKYWNRIGGPLLDRIDLRVALGDRFSAERREVEDRRAASFAQKLGLGPRDWLGTARELVDRAKRLQQRRHEKGGVRSNGKLRGSDVNAILLGETGISRESRRLLDRDNKRSGHMLVRIARTLADLDGGPLVDIHLELAAELRRAIVPMPGFEIQS